MSEIKLGRTYRHYKTKGLYVPLQVVTDTSDKAADGLKMLYFSLTANRLFVRDIAEWAGWVHQEGKSVPRFELREEK